MSRFHCIVLMACALAVPPLVAEPAVVVTPGNIADRIRSQNPDLAAARLRIDEAVGRVTQSGRLHNPEIELGFEHNSQFREGRFEIGFSQRFPVTDRLRIEKEITRTKLEAAEAEVREVERQLIAKARELLVKLLASRQRRELLREQSAVAKEFADFLGESAAKGEGSLLDAGQAR
ncbi:MAG: TolC family protein, partial [Luteolibacter sp.]